jgi:PTS system nitrogen regulatory IIA component
MMQAAEFLTRDRIRCKDPASSKKRALETGAGLLAHDVPSMSRLEIFDALNSRERLGSTGLGHGMALPHGRISGLESPIAACLTLAAPVDFDAPDRQKVDVLFLLLVPRDCSSEHLRILAGLAEMFNDPSLRETLRTQTEPDELLRALEAWTRPDDGAHAHEAG